MLQTELVTLTDLYYIYLCVTYVEYNNTLWILLTISLPFVYLKSACQVFYLPLELFTKPNLLIFSILAISQCLGIPLSFLSLVLSGIKLFYSQRLGKFAELDPSPKMMTFVAPLVILLLAGPLYTLVVMSIYLKEYILIYICIILFSNSVVLKKWMSNDTQKSMDLYTLRENTPISTCDQERSHQESLMIYMTAICTSWIAPCCVWSNNFTYKTHFLLALGITTCVCHIIGLCFLPFLLEENELFTPTNAASTLLCFQNNDISKNESHGEIVKLCHNNELCEPNMRQCLDGELPNDLFFKTIFPLGIGLLLITFVASFCLQVWLSIIFVYHFRLIQCKWNLIQTSRE